MTTTLDATHEHRGEVAEIRRLSVAPVAALNSALTFAGRRAQMHRGPLREMLREAAERLRELADAV